MNAVEELKAALGELSPAVDHAVDVVSDLTARLNDHASFDAEISAVAAALRNLKDVLESHVGAPPA